MSGRFAPYDSYQNSGFDWLGQVPNHWELQRLGGYFNERREKVSDEDFAALSVTMQGIVPQLEDAAKTKDGDNRKLVRKGDFVINSRSDRKGSSGVSPLDGSVSLIAIVLEPEGMYPDYIHHLLRSEAFQEEFYRFGKGIVADLWSTNYTSMKNITIPVIPEEEQKQIAAFLDYETAKIDALIDKQQQLIALLGEKRQAVISHAVTKGLNSDAPMRDSGVEWLGEVPAHWGVARAKNVASVFVPQRNKPELNPDGEGFYWVTMDQMKLKYISHSPLAVSVKAVKDAGSKVLLKGAVIASCVGQFEVASINKVDVIINQQLQAYIPTNICSEFLRLLVLLSQSYFDQVGTAATLVYVNQQGFEEMPVVVPPESEQLKIIEICDSKTEEIESLVSRIKESIELLEERRTALISAAVTGKIDVQNWQPPTDNKPYKSNKEAA